MPVFYDPYMRAQMESGKNMLWKSVDDAPFELEGFYWRKSGGNFRRLPECELPPGVEAHAPQSAGGMLRFKTDSPVIMIRASIKTRDNDADIMTYGRVGFDCYCGAPGSEVFAGVTRLNFDSIRSHESDYCSKVFLASNKRLREFTINFPLYAEVLKVEIGFEPDSKFEAPTPRISNAPIVWYGTSIVQGCHTSRPGLAGTNMISRMLNRTVLNYGFAGSAHGEPVIAELLAQIENPAMYLIDYDANTSEQELADTLPEFIAILRKKHPGTPIMTISRNPYAADYPFEPDETFETKTRLRREIHRNNLFKLREAGDNNIYFVDGTTLMGTDYSECSTDGVHPNDIGFYRTAQVLAPELRRILAM